MIKCILSNIKILFLIILTIILFNGSFIPKNNSIGTINNDLISKDTTIILCWKSTDANSLKNMNMLSQNKNVLSICLDEYQSIGKEYNKMDNTFFDNDKHISKQFNITHPCVLICYNKNIIDVY